MSIEVLTKSKMKHVFLSSNISFSREHLLGHVIYDWSLTDKTPFLFEKKIRITSVIDLRNTEEEIFSKFNATCRNEIRRVQKLPPPINKYALNSAKYRMKYT